MIFGLKINFSIFDQTSYPVNMDSNFTSRPQKIGSGEKDDLHLANLVLHNDDINSLDYVMEVLVDVCDHSVTQAEQCATITHFKGKCEVRSGSPTAMKELRYLLISRGLKATVDN